MKKKENYTVIMSIYSKVNANDLKISIESVLNQTYKTNEFIIIKDGILTEKLEDTLKRIVKKNANVFKIIELEKNMGAGYAYNKGIELCTNKWAAIMDSDDYAIPTKFEKQMNYLFEHADIDVIGSNAVEFINTFENIVSTRIMPEFNTDIIKFGKGRCPIIQPTAIFKVSSVKNAGSYQVSPLTEDYDLYIRMIISGCKFYNYQEVLYYVRTSDDFFKRRGGLKYLKPILSFKWKYYRNGFYSTKQFFKTASSSLVVSLLPNFVRKIVYKKFLRK